MSRRAAIGIDLPPAAPPGPPAGIVVRAEVALGGDGLYTVATPPAGATLLQAGLQVSAAYVGGVATISGPGLAGVLPLAPDGIAAISPGVTCDGSPIVVTVAGAAGVGDAVAFAVYSVP